MKATILHDADGHIIAISRAVDLKAAGSKFIKAGMVAQEGQHRIEIELPVELEKIALRDLHEQYRVDRGTATLVKTG
jgi:hypothetical protein